MKNTSFNITLLATIIISGCTNNDHAEFVLSCQDTTNFSNINKSYTEDSIYKISNKTLYKRDGSNWSIEMTNLEIDDRKITGYLKDEKEEVELHINRKPKISIFLEKNKGGYIISTIGKCTEHQTR